MGHLQYSNKYILIRVSLTRRWLFSTPLLMISSNGSLLRLLVSLILFFLLIDPYTVSIELAAYSKKSTISAREIQTSVRLILPGELSKHAISEGTKSVTKVSFIPLSLLTLLSDWCLLYSSQAQQSKMDQSFFIPYCISTVYFISFCFIYLANDRFTIQNFFFGHSFLSFVRVCQSNSELIGAHRDFGCDMLRVGHYDLPGARSPVAICDPDLSELVK